MVQESPCKMTPRKKFLKSRINKFFEDDSKSMENTNDTFYKKSGDSFKLGKDLFFCPQYSLTMEKFTRKNSMLSRSNSRSRVFSPKANEKSTNKFISSNSLILRNCTIKEKSVRCKSLENIKIIKLKEMFKTQEPPNQKMRVSTNINFLRNNLIVKKINLQ